MTALVQLLHVDVVDVVVHVPAIPPYAVGGVVPEIGSKKLTPSIDVIVNVAKELWAVNKANKNKRLVFTLKLQHDLRTVSRFT